MKKGFTLIELLAVITLLSLIALLILPNVLEQKEKTEKNLTESEKKVLYTDADKYIRDNSYDIIPNNVYCISISTLKDSGYASIDTTDFNNQIIRVTIDQNDNFVYSIVNSCEEVKN